MIRATRTLNLGLIMADRDFSRFIPPNLRQPLREAGAVGYNILDNLFGIDNDVDTTGELLGESLRRDPFGTAKAMGSGVVEGFQEAYADPEGTVDDLIAGFQEAYARASQPLPEDATPEEIGQRTSDLFALSAAIPGVGIAGQAVRRLPGEDLLPPAGRAVIRRDDVFRGEGPATVSEVLAASNAPYATRLTGMDQLEDMVRSGLVRPKPGGYGKGAGSTIYFGPAQTPELNTSVFNSLSEGKPVGLVGKPGTLAAYEGGIPIDELERIVVRQPDGTMLDMLDEILARNRGSR